MLRTTVAALPVALAGLVLLCAPGSGGGGRGVLIGCALSVVAAACYAVLTIAVRAIGTGPDLLGATRDGIGLGAALLLGVILLRPLLTGGPGPTVSGWTPSAVVLGRSAA